MKGFCVWLSGIPSSGKTTLANALKKRIQEEHGISATILDGDEVRANITKGLGFSPKDRMENMCRVAWMAGKIVDSGGIVIVAMVSPMEDAREAARNIIGSGRVFTCHIDVSIKEAINRDVKGLYAKAINGELTGLTGYDAPYETPVDPDCSIDTELCTVGLASASILFELHNYGWLPYGQYALFIGRWSPFHNGHKYIIDESIKAGNKVAIAVRNSKDLYFVDKRIEMIQAVYPDAWVFPMADINSVNIGRLVGYNVNRYDVPEDVAGISATEIRNKLKIGDESWRNNVPKEVKRFLEK